MIVQRSIWLDGDNGDYCWQGGLDFNISAEGYKMLFILDMIR